MLASNAFMERAARAESSRHASTVSAPTKPLCMAKSTPVEKTDANTRAVFGEYISVYDILRAVEDKAAVPIYYEGRLAKLGDQTPGCVQVEDVVERKLLALELAGRGHRV